MKTAADQLKQISIITKPMVKSNNILCNHQKKRPHHLSNDTELSLNFEFKNRNYGKSRKRGAKGVM